MPQPASASADAIAALALAAEWFTANDPLVAPAPVSAGSWPGSLGNDGGSASKIVPNSVSVVVGSWTLGPAAGLAFPPGTAVNPGDPGGAETLGRVVAGAVLPQAAATWAMPSASAIAGFGRRKWPTRRRGAVTGAS
jgi:hypothetical protein